MPSTNFPALGSEGWYPWAQDVDSNLVASLAALADTGWQALAVNSGFTGYTSGLQYRKVGGLVRLRGRITTTATTLPTVVAIATLPAGAWPSQQMSWAVTGVNGTWAKVNVNANGTVDIVTPSGTSQYVSFDPVSFFTN